MLIFVLKKTTLFMGYTHYWRIKNNAGNYCSFNDIENGKKKFKEAVELFRECLKYMNGKTMFPNWGDNAFTKKVDMVLCGGNGEGEPTIKDDLVCFNGCKATGNYCETCYFALDDESFNFCKTAREPYDTAVWVCILCFKYYFGENLQISSDGDESELSYATDIFNAVVDM